MLILGPRGTHFSHRITSRETMFYWLHFKVDSRYEFTDQIDIRQRNKRGVSFYVPSEETIYLPVYKRFTGDEWQEIMQLLKLLSSININKYYQSTDVAGEKFPSIVYCQEMFCKLLQILQIKPHEKEDTLASDVMNYL